MITGFGRLGKMFGGDVVGFAPHAISVAKALSSAYVPIAAVMLPEVMYQAMLVESCKIGTFGHGFTYSGHPVAAAVALKTLEIYARERIVEAVAAKIPRFQSRLRALGDHPLIGEARGLGLVGAIEFVADKRSKQAFDPKAGVSGRCAQYAQEEGLIVRALADAITLCPPLVISPAEIDDMFDRLAKALDRTLDWATREKLLIA